MKKIISCLVSIVLVLQLLGTASFGVWADETNKYSTCYVKFVLDDSTKYIKTIIKDECLMVNAQWLSGLLGLEYKTKSDFLNSAADLGNTLVSPVTDKYNYFAEKFGVDEVTIFKNDVERFTISKRGSSLKFTFEVGKSTATATSRAYGKMTVDLGTEVAAIEDEEGNKQYYVPLFMVCNIFNVVYYIEPQDEGNCIVLTDPQLTVVDIMHMQNKLSEYKMQNCLVDAINDHFCSSLGMVLGESFSNIVDSVVSLKLSNLLDPTKDNYDDLALQMCSADTDEVDKIAVHTETLNNAFTASPEIYSLLTGKVLNGEFLSSKKEMYREILQYDNSISLSEFEKYYKEYENVCKIKNVSDLLDDYTNLSVPMLFTGLSLMFETASTQDDYLKFMNTYFEYADETLSKEEKMGYNYIQDRMKIYESSFDNAWILLSDWDMLSNIATFAAEELTRLQLGRLGLAAAAGKWGVNLITGGVFDFNDLYYNCMVNQVFQNSSQKVVASYLNESDFDLDTYRALEWTRLKSYYVAQENGLELYKQYYEISKFNADANPTLSALYQVGFGKKDKYSNEELGKFAEKLYVFKNYEIASAFEDYNVMIGSKAILDYESEKINSDTEVLAEYMAILLYGREGTTPEYIKLCEEYAQSNNEYVIENDCALYQQIECTVVDSENNVGVVGAELEFSVENGVKATVATGEDGKVINIEAYIPVGLYNLKVTALGYENYEYESKIEVKIDEQCKIGEIILEKSNFKWHLKPSVEADDIIVSDLIYDTSNGFNASYECAVIEQNGFYGVINNTTGKILIQPEFTYFKYETLTGYVVVANDNYTTEDDYTICNGSSGIEVVDSNICERGWEFEDYYVDSLTGQIYVDGYGSGILFSDNHNVVVRSISGSYNENTGFYQFDYETIGSKYGIGGKDGLIVKCDYDDAKSQIYPENSNLIALAYDSKWGYFDENGEKIIDFICEPWENLYNSNILESRPFLATGGYIPVKINSKCGYYDTEGNEIIPVGTFAEVRPVHNKLAWVKDTATGLWGVIELVEEETIASPPSESLENDDAWKNLYRNELLRYMRSSDYTSDVMFDLYDLDGNGVPELLISQGAAHVSSCIIYTVYQGTLINIGNYGVYGSVEYSQKYRLLAAQNSHMGYWHGYYYSIAADGTMTEQFSFDTNWAATSNEDELYYIINGTNVTSEEFDAAIAEYDDGEWISVGRKYEFSEEEILSALT